MVEAVSYGVGAGIAVIVGDSWSSWNSGRINRVYCGLESDLCCWQSNDALIA